MVKFKDFLEENLAFSNAGGPVGQYDKYDFTNNPLICHYGGPPIEEDVINENLNPRKKPIMIQDTSNIFNDPENTNINLNRLITLLHENTDHQNPIYKEYMDFYTRRSDNLNSTLWNNYRDKKTSPDEILSHNLKTDRKPIINLNKFDSLIHSHKAPENITVYSGLHYHPIQYKGKIMYNPAYLSTSLSPHVSKDFGMKYETEENGDFIPLTTMLKFTIPKGHPMLYTGSGSHSPEQHEIILPRGIKYQLGQLPTYILKGDYKNHHNEKSRRQNVHLWQARILPNKKIII